MTATTTSHDDLPAEPEYYASDVLLEEESFSWYTPESWYPIQIDEVLNERYKVLVKLGYGSASTAWLCRDLETQEHVTVKVFMTGHRQSLNEVQILQHLETVDQDHPGAELIRRMTDSFELIGKAGPHTCIVHKPMGLSLRDVRDMAGGQTPSHILKPLVYGVLLGLDYLHTKAHVVHTDIQESNIMLSITDPSIDDQVVEEERLAPSPRKKTEDGRIIYTSIEMDMLEEPGLPAICDFGDARVGPGPFEGEIMPDLYRAPEIVLGIPWDEKVDIWGFGSMVWDLLQGRHLFTERLPSREESSAAHLARMVALLGPAPKDLLQRSMISSRFFHRDGSLKHPQPATTTLENEESILEAKEQIRFLAFIRRTLQWRPEDRATAKQLLRDPWLQQ